jgi:hypothetical protein
LYGKQQCSQLLPNQPHVIASLNAAFSAYEAALLRSDVKPFAELHMVVDLLTGVDRQLDHRDVCFWKHMGQHRPCSVVQPPAVLVIGDEARPDDCRDFVGKLRRPRRWIVEVEQRLRKTKKSWMTRGLDMAVTALPPMNQCADTMRIALGGVTLWPNSRHAEV